LPRRFAPRNDKYESAYLTEAEIATILPETSAKTGLFLPVEACLNPTVAVQQQTAKSKFVKFL